VIKIKWKNLMTTLAFLAIAMLASPVLAIGPTHVPENKNPNLISNPPNTQIWLPSGVMNEWIATTIFGDLKVTLKDAAKFQIKTAISQTLPEDIPAFLATENQWFYWTQNDFAVFLIGGGYDPAVADPYEEGVYIMMNYVG
jgi:hypothetical protein